MITDKISQNILSLLIFFPLLAAFFILILPKDARFLKHTAMGATILEFLFSLHLLRFFMPSTAQFQFSQISNWLPVSSGIKYIVGIDGLSLGLVLLTTTFSMLVMMTTYTSIKTKVKGFLVLFLMLEATLIGVFVSLDVVLFYVFWEASLIPVYFMIGIWGGKERIYATLKFFVYGVTGSLLMLVCFLYLYSQHAVLAGKASTNLLDLYLTAAHLPFATQCTLFCGITLAFAIKVPLFPFYTWLPDAYEQAPATYTLMSGVILKLATYGLIRFSLCLFPAAAAWCAKPILILAVVGILYGALIAWRQTNIRRIMAFSSLSHMGFLVAGIFAFNSIALQGALYQMWNHTITAGALFFLFHFLHQRLGTFNIHEFGGLAKSWPWFSFFFMVAVFGAVALPGTGSFIGEWLILMGVFQYSPLLGSLATLGVILGALYMLLVAYKVLFGPLGVSVKNQPLPSLGGIEVFQLIVLSVFIFIMGFASTPMLEHSKATLLRIEQTALHQVPYRSTLFCLRDGFLSPLTQQKTGSAQP